MHCISCTCRNPFFPKYFLSVGDWTWRVWNEDLRSPLLVSPYAGAYLSSGTWSPTRPGGCELLQRASGGMV
jgi:dynein intermediate chain 2